MIERWLIISLWSISYTLRCEKYMLRSLYARLLFTGEHQLNGNLRVQEQSTNITSQWQYLALTWRYGTLVMTSQYQVRKKPSTTPIGHQSSTIFILNILLHYICFRNGFELRIYEGDINPLDHSDVREYYEKCKGLFECEATNLANAICQELLKILCFVFLIILILFNALCKST